jgi:hypothetical protein
VWVLVIVASVSLAAGFGIGRLVRSPDELAKETAVPPEGLITARVEAREITSTVTARADVVFDDPVRINPTAPDGVPVVTGQVPEVGAEVSAGDVVLEVSGRPVFVLPGEFQSFRAMGPGSSGPDVAQLRQALAGLGFNAGNTDSKAYDATVAGAVKALYDQAGYPPPGSEDPALEQGVRGAQDGVTDSREARDQAAKALADARKQVAAAPDAETKAQAEDAVGAAESGLKQAERGVERAEEALADAQRAAWTTVPMGEVVFVTGLPRRVDQVNVKVGSNLNEADTSGGDPMMGGGTGEPSAAVVLSGAEIKVTAQVNTDEAALLQAGGPAVLAVDQTEIVGEITEICPEAAESGTGSAAAGGTCEIGITVADLAGVDPESMVGNVLVTMVVGTTSADSLVVPLAAVSADTAGNARIEVVEGELAKDQAAADQATRVVAVETGLTAEGMVEVVAAPGELKAGDLVVIGQGRQAESPATGEEGAGSDAG